MAIPGLESVQVRIELTGAKPPVWRSFVVPVHITLHQLHLAIQAVMGWEDAHLYEFRAGDEVAALPNPEVPRGVKNSRLERLDYWLDDGLTHLDYVYDLGDGWEHLIAFGETRFDGPRVLEGAGACPPEDCGGLPGLEELLRVRREPGGPRHKEVSDWLKGWQANVFDAQQARERLAKVELGPSGAGGTKGRR